ncbi:MAG: 50S ribosomal protein L17 [Deltaproteobacteria bacterium]|nr:50S ribosomal protein L17 [Deltaproteobacteria bacterium]
MRHRKARTKLGMRTAQRQAMLRNMVTSLMEHESITTTDARAKALRSLGDRMITLGKRGDLHARRLALRVFRSKEVARRLFEEIAPRYANREGGYVRILKKGARPGDGAPLSVVELVEKSATPAAGKPSKAKKGIKDRLIDTIKSK